MTTVPNVVDSSGWLEWFADGPGAAHFAEPLGRPEALIVPSLSLFEVFKRVLQQRDESSALQAKLSVELRLPMADAVILATARRFGALLWTQDADFEGIPGTRYFVKARR